MMIVTIQEVGQKSDGYCTYVGPVTEIGAFPDDKKKEAIARASAKWEEVQHDLVTCRGITREFLHPKYDVFVQQYDDQGVKFIRTVWGNGIEYVFVIPTVTGDDTTTNAFSSSVGPSGWQILGAVVLAAGVAYGTYRVTDAMIAPKDRRLA